MTRLYSSGVLRYAENDSDIDFALKMKYTAKGCRVGSGLLFIGSNAKGFPFHNCWNKLVRLVRRRIYYMAAPTIMCW